MLALVRRFLDVRRGEGLLVLLAFLDIAVVVAAFLLAKPIRNGLFLEEYGAYALVYVYAAVPLVLTAFVPLYGRIAARVGTRAVTVGTLLFFALNVLGFWAAFRAFPVTEGAQLDAGQWFAWLLPAAFYVWVNCFAVIAPVQAWSFANSLFDTRQARRLFGVVGAGASLGAIAGGIMARVLVKPVGGAVNMLLVLAALILLAAGIQLVAQLRVRRRDMSRVRRQPAPRFLESLVAIRRSRYLVLMSAMVFVVAIVTQWIAFQLSLVATERYGEDADAITAFFGTFNYVVGILGLVLQFALTGPALRRFGVAVTIMLLPLALGVGSALILVLPVFWTVLLTAGSDQALRFTVDKASYELLYLPLPQPQRAAVKAAIDIVVNRFADATGAVLLGLATQGFFMVGGFGLGLRGTAAINLVLIGAWTVLAWRLRVEYVRTIHDSIHKHRLDLERDAANMPDPLTSGVMRLRLTVGDAQEILATLDLISGQPPRKFMASLLPLLTHPTPEVRRRVLSMLGSRHDPEVSTAARRMLRDPDIGVRTEALLYVTREEGTDPLRVMEQLGDFADFSIRAGMASFFAASKNTEAARALLEAMLSAQGPDATRERQEAARLLPRMPPALHDLFLPLLADPESSVARQAVRAAGQLQNEDLIPALIGALARPGLADEAAEALARFGPAVVDDIADRLRDPHTPAEIKRELPQVLVRIGSADAELVLIDSLLQPDASVRHAIVVSLNLLQASSARVRIDRAFLELVLAMEIAGHYRSYQQLGRERAHASLSEGSGDALPAPMTQELERIFRLIKLLLPHVAMHDAYVGVRSSVPGVRANALEFLENVLPPDFRALLLPLIDPHVTLTDRVALANQLVGAPMGDTGQAVAALLASANPWLRRRAIYAVGALRLHGLASELRRIEPRADSSEKAAIRQALYQLESDSGRETQPTPAELGIGIG